MKIESLLASACSSVSPLSDKLCPFLHFWQTDYTARWEQRQRNGQPSAQQAWLHSGNGRREPMAHRGNEDGNRESWRTKARSTRSGTMVSTTEQRVARTMGTFRHLCGLPNDFSAFPSSRCRWYHQGSSGTQRWQQRDVGSS